MALQTKLLIFFIVLVLILTLQWLLFVDHERRVLSEETEERAGVLARTLAELSREPLASSRISRLETQLDSIKHEKDVVYARIVSDGFRVLADTRKREEGWIHSGEIAGEFAVEKSGGLILARAPIRILDRTAGMAEVAFSPDSMVEKTNRNRAIFIQILAFQLLAGAAFHFLMNLQIIGPLRRLTMTITAVPPGSERRRIETPRFASVEIRRMISSMNEMRESLFEFQKEMVVKARFATMGKIAADMAHEIRNPLEAISGAAELLGSAVAPGTESAEYLSVIRDEIRNLNEYLGAFLESAGAEPSQRATVDLWTLLNETLLLLNPLARRSGIALKLAPRGGPAACRVDRNQLKRVFLNIVLNGIEAGGPGGCVEIEVKASDGFARAAVSDDGPGLPPAVRERLFEPFFTTKTGGTGLGLALSKRTLDAHGGSIRLVERAGGGTRVELALPLEGEEPDGADSHHR